MSNKIQHKAFITSFDDTTEGLVKAFVSVYGNVDSANEICDFGCFKDSLEYKYPVFCLYHNWEMPIGKVIVAEEIPAGDQRLPDDLKEWGGLYVEAQINLDKEMGRDAWSDIKHGVLDEYSIGYVVQEDFVDKQGYRHLTKVDLIEASPVVRAANRKTKTVEVKSDQSLETNESAQENTQINTKQMNELLERIQQLLADVMSPLDELRVQMAQEGILDEMEAMLDSVQNPAQQSLGALDELRIALAEAGYLEEVSTDTYDEEEEDKQTEEVVEAKALDLQQVLGFLSEIISLAENAMSIEMQWEGEKSIDNITEQIIGLMNVVQTELDNPSGEVDLQAMVDAFAIVNANVDELIAEAQNIDPEMNPEVNDYIATLRNIGGIATQLTEVVMAEMEAPTEEAQEEEEDSKAVDSIPLSEQIELEQMFSRYIQSQFNIN